MRLVTLVNDTCLIFGCLGSDNLNKAKQLISTALQLDPSTFEERYSEYLGGWYYRHNQYGILIQRNEGEYDKGIRIICHTQNNEQAQKILAHYHKICVNGKPVIK